MKTNDLVKYGNDHGMHVIQTTDEFGNPLTGIEWKNNSVYYWFVEFLNYDGDLCFVERYSQRTGKSTKRYCETTWNIIWSVKGIK